MNVLCSSCHTVYAAGHPVACPTCGTTTTIKSPTHVLAIALRPGSESELVARWLKDAEKLQKSLWLLDIQGDRVKIGIEDEPFHIYVWAPSSLVTRPGIDPQYVTVKAA